MVMGPTDPERHGPYGAPERAVVRRLPCSFCHRRFAEAKACLLEIPPERLAERAAELLAAQ
jgi:ADP-heptose:LPS heptosyltransferase